MALNQQRKKSQFLAEIALAFLVFFGSAPVASAGIIDDISALPGQLAEGARIITREVAPAFFNPSSLASVFNDIKCFFGVDCQKPPAVAPAEVPNPKNQVPNNIQESNINQDTAGNANTAGQGLTSAPAEDRPSNTNPPTQIIQNINPTKEVQTIRTINNNTNTVVVDNCHKKQSGAAPAPDELR